MVPFRILDDREVGAIFPCLRTVPALSNAASEAYVIEATDRGQQIDYKYGCNGCHGDTGPGPFDLRKGSANHPTDDGLVADIERPERTRPGIAMPTWDGVIAEDEYGPLAAYVRTPAAGGR